MQSKSGAEHLQSLKDGRTVYIDGTRVDDVTTHPAFRNAVASAALLYDYQARPENIELMTFMPEGGTLTSSAALPTSRRLGSSSCSPGNGVPSNRPRRVSAPDS